MFRCEIDTFERHFVLTVQSSWKTSDSHNSSVSEDNEDALDNVDALLSSDVGVGSKKESRNRYGWHLEDSSGGTRSHTDRIVCPPGFESQVLHRFRMDISNGKGPASRSSHVVGLRHTGSESLWLM